MVPTSFTDSTNSVLLPCAKHMVHHCDLEETPHGPERWGELSRSHSVSLAEKYWGPCSLASRARISFHDTTGLWLQGRADWQYTPARCQATGHCGAILRDIWAPCSQLLWVRALVRAWGLPVSQLVQASPGEGVRNLQGPVPSLPTHSCPHLSECRHYGHSNRRCTSHVPGSVPGPFK